MFYPLETNATHNFRMVKMAYIHVCTVRSKIYANLANIIFIFHNNFHETNAQHDELFGSGEKLIVDIWPICTKLVACRPPTS